MTVRPGDVLVVNQADRHVSRALAAIHAEPQRAWSLNVLAQEAHLSRSSFAARFHRLVGQTPTDYVNRWRMQLAADILTDTQTPVTLIAQQVGDQSWPTTLLSMFIQPSPKPPPPTPRHAAVC